MNELQEFKRFNDLFIPGTLKKTKKYNSELQKEAKFWWIDNFKAVFGNCTKNYLTWYYSCGLLMFCAPDLGGYVYHFIIKMIHFEMWKTPEWKEGRRFGNKTRKSEISPFGGRDANPYTEENFYSHTAWDCGYIMGISNISFLEILKKQSPFEMWKTPETIKHR